MMLWLARFLSLDAISALWRSFVQHECRQTELTEGSRVLGYTGVSADCGLSGQASAVGNELPHY